VIPGFESSPSTTRFRKTKILNLAKLMPAAELETSATKIPLDEAEAKGNEEQGLAEPSDGTKYGSGRR
jgi:hypothetical protein